MTDNASRQLPSLRRYLLLWFAGIAIVMVFAYTQLLEYYLELGIGLRSQSILEQAAQEYVSGYGEGDGESFRQPELPNSPGLRGYLQLSDIPPQIQAAFANEELEHGEVIRYTNLDFNAQDQKEFAIETFDFCPKSNCELLFLYPYNLNGDDWLYLVHGVVGSEEIHEELAFTDQFAFAVGSLFTGLLALIAFLIVRNIDTPLRKLDRWSAAQDVASVERDVPDLRFQEFSDLADRIQFAFDRMREGVNKEKLFLRHASHELRTPIAILSSNVELIDRLTDRPERTEAEQAAFVRQYRALEDVQLLMETLLWINRQTDHLPEVERIDLRAELDVIVENYRYLLEARDVVLSIEGAAEAKLPLAAVRIVVSNLVRNAFQYTVDGEVRIRINAQEVAVENISVSDLTPPPRSDDDYGFGLGLELVSLICKRFAWRYTTTENLGGRVTVVSF